MQDELKPLYVRLPSTESDQLSELSRATGRSKRQLVGEAVRRHLTDSGELIVGRAELRQPLPDVMTLPEAASLLRIDEQALAEAASRGETPGRLFGEEWRFSREGLLAWLAGA